MCFPWSILLVMSPWVLASLFSRFILSSVWIYNWKYTRHVILYMLISPVYLHRYVDWHLLFDLFRLVIRVHILFTHILFTTFLFWDFKVHRWCSFRPYLIGLKSLFIHMVGPEFLFKFLTHLHKSRSGIDFPNKPLKGNCVTRATSWTCILRCSSIHIESTVASYSILYVSKYFSIRISLQRAIFLFQRADVDAQYCDVDAAAVCMYIGVVFTAIAGSF